MCSGNTGLQAPTKHSVFSTVFKVPTVYSGLTCTAVGCALQLWRDHDANGNSPGFTNVLLRSFEVVQDKYLRILIVMPLFKCLGNIKSTLHLWMRIWYSNLELPLKFKLKNFPGVPVAKIVAPNAGGAGLIPGPGTRPQRPQLRILMLQRRLKISHAATKNWHSQINKNKMF